MQAAKAVVFDIGNVLVEWHPEKLYGRLIPDPAARAAFFAESGVEAMNLEVDRGAPFPGHIEAHAERNPRHAEMIRAWARHWHEMFHPAIPGTVTLLRALRRRGVPVHALSNFGAESFERARQLYPFLDEFDIPVISGRERTIKPEPRIYAILEERTGLAGDALLFADDREENIAAARARGWHGHLFRDPDGLARELRAHGLIDRRDWPG
jgi:2-haloacid dehalogenase